MSSATVCSKRFTPPSRPAKPSSLGKESKTNVPDQLRYNTGKPQLSYLYANHRALAAIDFSGEPTYAAACTDLMYFTAGGPRFYLRRAVGSWIRAMNIELAAPADDGSEDFIENYSFGFTLNLPEVVDAFLHVCVTGARKYLRGNYRQGAGLSNYIDSAWRHIHRMDFGEVYDPDSQPYLAEGELPTLHSAHVLWNLIMCLDQPDRRDDRLPPVQFGEFDFGDRHSEFDEVDSDTAAALDVLRNARNGREEDAKDYGTLLEMAEELSTKVETDKRDIVCFDPATRAFVTFTEDLPPFDAYDLVDDQNVNLVEVEIDTDDGLDQEYGDFYDVGGAYIPRPSEGPDCYFYNIEAGPTWTHELNSSPGRCGCDMCVYYDEAFPG
jgi:hypothetical protein